MTSPASYYDRTSARHTDGTLTFETAGDAENERRVQALLEERWKCSLHRYPRLHPIDWYGVRDERLVSHVELKCRSKPSTAVPHAILNMRKYTALLLLEMATGHPSLFVAAFSDGAIYWTRASTVDATNARMYGTKQIVKSSTDIEPCLLIPLTQMHRLEAA